MVQKTLKDEISLELKRSFPTRKVAKKKDDKDKKPEETKAADTQGEDKGSDKVFDKISGVILEEINNQHILVRGRKEVLFKKNKRTVELEFLVARRDISDEDTVLSENVIEANIIVLR